tara:strand:+ start:271 stop:414 length:144 start_codon:yes stop_codon:yes gene_type:complete
MVQDLDLVVMNLDIYQVVQVVLVVDVQTILVQILLQLVDQQVLELVV